MRKGTIVLAAIFAVAITSGAEAARKKAAPAQPAMHPVLAANANTATFLHDAVQPWRPARPAPGAKPAKGKKR